jgi:hypothetical protein
MTVEYSTPMASRRGMPSNSLKSESERQNFLIIIPIVWKIGAITKKRFIVTQQFNVIAQMKQGIGHINSVFFFFSAHTQLRFRNTRLHKDTFLTGLKNFQVKEIEEFDLNGPLAVQSPQ